MYKIRSLILLLLLVNSASAHNPQVSTISIIQNEHKKWFVFITAPLYTCQTAIHENYPSLKIDTLNAFETQKLILNLVKTSFIINGDNTVKLINDKIQLAHETTLYFDIQSDKPNFSPSVVSFSAFSKLTNHFTLLKIVPNKGKEISYILNSDNEFNYPKIKNQAMSTSSIFNFNKYIDIVSRIGIRYILIAGATFIFFYVLFKRKIFYKKIQNAFPKNSDYIREFTYSIITIMIFGIIIVTIMGNPNIRPYTKIYEDIQERGWLYYFAAFPIMLIMHDTYFYWTHRIMHHKLLFNTFHLVHHKSTNPSPWAAYAFHPLEAVVENGIFIIFAFSFPLHESHTPIFFLFSVIYNIYGHLGWELYPKGFNKSFIGKWVNTSVCHNQHHKYFKGNYGLYLIFWDRIMGTLRDDYDMAYEEVKNR
jgi:sterol desaturase/sphingolipid hydroxylase (fatty acid hydroxylase superfamily)